MSLNFKVAVELVKVSKSRISEKEVSLPPHRARCFLKLGYLGNSKAEEDLGLML